MAASSQRTRGEGRGGEGRGGGRGGEGRGGEGRGEGRGGEGRGEGGREVCVKKSHTYILYHSAKSNYHYSKIGPSVESETEYIIIMDTRSTRILCTKTVYQAQVCRAKELCRQQLTLGLASNADVLKVLAVVEGDGGAIEKGRLDACALYIIQMDRTRTSTIHVVEDIGVCVCVSRIIHVY